MPSVPYEAGELLRVVAESLTARGFRVRREPSASSRRITVTRDNGTGQDSSTSEVIVEDDGYVEWRYWPETGRPADPAALADLIAGLLSAGLPQPGEEL
jgi:hypothetical protein